MAEPSAGGFMPEPLAGLVSVIVPAYNEERFIGEALDSAFAQDYRQLEVIVVDDGSTDRTAEIASRYDVHMIRQPNQGPAAARNAGLRAARGEYIGILDGDDIWPARRVTTMVSALERSGAGIARGLLELFVTPGEQKPAHFPADYEEPYAAREVTLFVRHSVYQSVGGFDEAKSVGEDTDWFMRAREAGASFEDVPEVVTRYRIHEGNISMDRAVRRNVMLQLLRESIQRRRRR